MKKVLYSRWLHVLQGLIDSLIGCKKHDSQETRAENINVVDLALNVKQT